MNYLCTGSSSWDFLGQVRQGVTDFQIGSMGVQCVSLSHGRQNSTMSLPNQMYKIGGTSSTVHLRSPVTSKRKMIWNAGMSSTKVASQEHSITTKSGQNKVLEERWQKFLSDPSQWWDHRSGKTSAKFPDFKHKKTQEALWVKDRSNPQWVEAQLSTMTPGTVKQPLSSWNNQLAKYVKDNKNEMALEAFDQMQQEGVQADGFTFIPALKACENLRALKKGRDIHTRIIQNGCEADLFVGPSLFDMYIKCGSIEDAQRVLKSMPTQDVVSWTAMIAAHVKRGQGQKGLDLYRQMLLAKLAPVPRTYVAVLHACASVGALDEGKRVHAQIIQSGCELDVAVSNSLIDMYSKCGSINDARRVFNKMRTRNVFTWNSMIGGYVKGGHGHKALEIYRQMQVGRVGFVPTTFMLVLKACANLGALDKGRHVHAHITKSDCESNVFVGRSLVDMYSKCGSIEDAEKVFDMMPACNVISWTAMIGGYVKCGEGHKALQLYRQMLVKKVAPSPATFVAALNACASIVTLEEGRQVHAEIVESGCDSDMFINNSLIDMYSKCGSIVDARAVFDKLRMPNVVSWSAIILAHVNCGEGWKAIKLYKRMLSEGIKPFPATFLAVLKACASVTALDEGRRVHARITQCGCESDLYVSSSLIDMYSKCGSIKDARRVFREMHTRNVVSWNAMIGGSVRCGQGQEAVDLYWKMQAEGLEPAPVTFVGVLSACGSVKALEEGKRVHTQIIQSRYESDDFVGSSLIDMYSNCGSIEDAHAVFMLHKQNVICWNSMISGYVKCGQGLKALELYKQMQAEGLELNQRSFIGGLNACASLAAVEEGRRAHAQIIQCGFDSDMFVGSSLVDMYSQCGSIKDARTVFDKMHTRSVVTWNAMILGYVNCGEGEKALELYTQMQAARIVPVTYTFVTVLKACSSVAALEEGRRVHAQISKCGVDSDIFVGTSVVDMYAKCGSIEDALQMFNNMPIRDVVCWNTMLGGYAMHGHAKEALQLFESMRKELVEIDSFTFISLLAACNRGGLLKEGLHYFESMSSVYGIPPRREHYTCMVDLLGRSGHLHEAEDMIKRMPYEPDVTVWRSLLAGCRIHGNFEMGERTAKRILELDPGKTSSYIGLSNIYAAAGKWDCIENVRQMRMERGDKKEPGRTFIEVNHKVHSFTEDDQEHPQIADIHTELSRLSELMKEAGYVPDTCLMFHDVGEEEQVSPSCHHSEKLAIAFGLISTPASTSIRIVKNCRVCKDCHTAIKFISEINDRTIIVRDANRFHHFKKGLCSCRDHW